eukprot:2383647-Alexandrium_andersonii.AAC.1
MWVTRAAMPTRRHGDEIQFIMRLLLTPARCAAKQRANQIAFASPPRVCFTDRCSQHGAGGSIVYTANSRARFKPPPHHHGRSRLPISCDERLRPRSHPR